MPNLKGTQTEKNIMAAFAGESQARNRYTFFASKAKNEGYVQISAAFTAAFAAARNATAWSSCFCDCQHCVLAVPALRCLRFVPEFHCG